MSSISTYCSCAKCGARYKLEGEASGIMPCPKCGGQVKPLPVAQALDPSELTARRPAAATAVAPPAPATGGINRRVLIGGWILAAGVGIGAVVLILQISTQRNAPAVIKIDWPVEERTRGAMEISGQQSAVPPKGPLVFKVATGPHRVVLRRPGFAPVTWEFTLFAAEERVLKPAWEPKAQ